MKLHTPLLACAASATLAGCYDSTLRANPGLTNPPLLGLGAPATYAKAAYVDAFALGALAQITAAAEWPGSARPVAAWAQAAQSPSTAASATTCK